MACKHKFYDDLELGYCDWTIDTLIVGTFNPEWAKSNDANWFYGRKNNNFWYIMSKLYNENDLTCLSKEEKLKFCSKNKIGITDLIKSIKTAKQEEHLNIISSFSDKAIEENFDTEELEILQLVEILQSKPSIKNVFLTRSATNGLWKKLWSPVKNYCRENNIYCTELLTPSNYAFYQYRKKERENYGSLEDFIYYRWKDVWSVK